MGEQTALFTVEVDCWSDASGNENGLKIPIDLNLPISTVTSISVKQLELWQTSLGEDLRYPQSSLLKECSLSFCIHFCCAINVDITLCTSLPDVATIDVVVLLIHNATCTCRHIDNECEEEVPLDRSIEMELAVCSPQLVL